MPGLRLLEMFRQSETTASIVLDEYGGVQGLITISDLSGGWLLDGSTPVEELAQTPGIRLPEGEHRDYHTTGGLILDRLGHLPRTGEVLDVAGHRFEVVDLDGRRIDRVMVTPPEGGEPGQSAPTPS
jgi:Hemolysins and related proteins containing CBS domains